MSGLMNGLYNFCNTFSPLVYLLVACALIVAGAMFVIPSQKTREKAKEALPYILLGCGLVLGAMTIANEISSSFVFGGA